MQIDPDRIFKYHPPFGNQPERYTQIREMARHFALLLNEKCPSSPELTLAIRHLQQTVMFANAAIAINEVQEVPASDKGGLVPSGDPTKQ